MGKKNKIVVNILSKDYKLKSNDSIEHMERVAKYVQKKIEETKEHNRKVNATMLAVLTALNISDEYIKLFEYNKELEKRVENPEYELQLIRSKLNRISKAFEEKNKAYNKIISEFNELFRNSAEYEDGLSELQEEVRSLRTEINTKEKEIKASDKKIEQLKEKLDEKDHEAEEAKKELNAFIDAFDERQSN